MALFGSTAKFTTSVFLSLADEAQDHQRTMPLSKLNATNIPDFASVSDSQVRPERICWAKIGQAGHN